MEIMLMNDEWRHVTIEEIAGRDGVAGGPFGSDLVRSDYTISGVPVIRGTNLGVSGSRFSADDFVYVSDAKADALARNIAKPGDVVVTQRGTLGQVGLVPDIGVDRFVISQSQMRLRCDATKADPLFVYYWLLLPDTVHHIEANAVATGVPHINLGFFKGMKLCLPPLWEQRAIARVLGALDDKIELNRRTNETLEAMARALFTSWFVDFDPVHAKKAGRAPEGMDAATTSLFPADFVLTAEDVYPRGWSTRSLYDCAVWINGAAYRDFLFSSAQEGLPIVKIAELKAGVTAQTRFTTGDPGEKYRIDTGDVLFSWSGNPDTSIDTFVWFHGPAWLNQHIFKVVAASPQDLPIGSIPGHREELTVEARRSVAHEWRADTVGGAGIRGDGARRRPKNAASRSDGGGGSTAPVG